MFQLLTAALILAANPWAPIVERYPNATEVFTCNFGEGWDVNYDAWPDRWTRREGPGFPRYLDASIIDNATISGGRCLQMSLDGGAIALECPPIEVTPSYSYVLEAQVRTSDLVHDGAYLAITFLDAQGRPLDRFQTEGVRTGDDWSTLGLGPVASAHPSARFLVIEIGVGPGDNPGDDWDLWGTASFADLWVGRQSRIAVHTNHPFNFFREGEQVEVSCDVTGLDHPVDAVMFELADVFGRVLQRDLVPVAVGTPFGKIPLASQFVDASATDLAGTAHWKPDLPALGFYTVRVRIDGPKAPVHRHELSLAVLKPAAPVGGNFGWSLPDGELPLSLSQLTSLLGESGIGWVKFPLWYDETDTARADALVRFVEQANAHGISLIGLLARPPASVRNKFGRPGTLAAADIFTADPKVWYPSVETVLLRLSMKVRWWQLGTDEDRSFVGLNDLTERMGAIKQRLDSTGRNVYIGFAWDWLHELPGGRDVPWRFVDLGATPPLTAAELASYLSSMHQEDCERFVVLDPLPRDQYTTEVRAVDLVERMVASRIYGAAATFVPRPFDDQRGLMNADGTPGELFLPWRTTAHMLAGADYLGSLQLPAGSQNHVFARGDEAVMLVWNNQPTRETLYLGEAVEQTDLWGRRLHVQRDGEKNALDVQALPTFVSGINGPVTRWRLGVEFAKSRLPSVFGQTHTDILRFTNPFPVGVSGTVRLVMPDGWITEPDEILFQLSAGESVEQPIAITLPYTASSGRHAVRLDFVVTADREYRMSVYRVIQVGLGEVEIEVTSRLNAEGDLEVEQCLINTSDEPVSFSCDLYVPGRRRLRGQVLWLGRGQDVQTYTIPDGADLLGQTLWLQAHELGGSRALSYRFVAEP